MVKAVCVLKGDGVVTGSVQFEQEGSGPVTLTGQLTGLADGLHGLHVHSLVTILMDAQVPDLTLTLMDVPMELQLMGKVNATLEILEMLKLLVVLLKLLLLMQ